MTTLSLPAPKQKPLEITAQKYFGVSVHPGTAVKTSSAPAIFWNGDLQTAVSLHRTRKYLESYTEKYQLGSGQVEDVLPGLFRIFSRLTNREQGMMVCVRALRTNYSAYSRHIYKLTGRVNPPYQEFLQASLKWVNPTAEGQYFSHDLLVWGPASDFVPTLAKQETCAIDPSTLINYQAAGALLKDTLYRYPIRFQGRIADPITGGYDMLSWAAPDEHFNHHRYAAYQHHAQAYWLGELTAQNLPPLLASDLDILLWLRQAGEFLYQTVIIRADASLDKAEPYFDSLTDTLNRSLGKWDRLTANNINIGREGFVPGGKFLPESLWYSSLPDFRTVLDILGKAVRPSSDDDGLIFLGKLDNPQGGSYFINPKINPTLAFTGTSKTAGKSTLAASKSLAFIPPIWIALTTTFGDRAGDWAEKYGGSVKRLRLPDAESIITEQDLAKDQTPNLDKKRVQKLQNSLHAKDGRDAAAFAKGLIASWINHGEQVDLPLVFLPETESIRVINWLQVFLQTIMKEDAIKFWFEQSGLYTLFVLDNWSRITSIYRTGNTGILGDIPVTVANNMAQTVGDMINNAANKGGFVWILTHDETELDVIGKNFIRNFSLQLTLGHDDNHEKGILIRPKDGEPVVENLYIRLPYPILKEVERTTDVVENPNGYHPEEGEGVETLEILTPSQN